VTELALRVDDLHRALLDNQPTIVHFSGHGAGSHGLVLENNSGRMQLVSTESLARLFGLFQRQIECVLLNACYSEAQALAIHQHIDYVIGMNQTIGDKAAIKFAVGFYDALGANRSYGDCFEFGCTLVDLQGIPESQTPVLKARKRPSVPENEKEPQKDAPKEQNAQVRHREEISPNFYPSQVCAEAQASQGTNNEQTQETNVVSSIEKQFTDQSRSFTVENTGGDFKPIGSVMMSDNVEISGTVAEYINQLPASPDPQKLSIKELLSPLTEAISTSSDINHEDKAEALDQVKILAKAGKNPDDRAMKRTARTAIKILQGTVSGLPNGTNLADVCSKLLPLISELFGL
jgi:hypothetical protein